MDTDNKTPPLGIVLLHEITITRQLTDAYLKRALPDGMEVAHFSVLDYLARNGGESAPGGMARVFHVTKGAMTNTVARLEAASYISVRPDNKDGRRKRIILTQSGKDARDIAFTALQELTGPLVEQLGTKRISTALPLLSDLRDLLLDKNGNGTG